jgi:hypothetical protein
MQSFLNYIVCALLVALCGLQVPVVSYAPRPIMKLGLAESENDLYDVCNERKSVQKYRKLGYIRLKYRS